MIKCKTCGTIFKQYDYKIVIWSGDKLPCCPVCQACPYDNDFEKVGNKED